MGRVIPSAVNRSGALHVDEFAELVDHHARKQLVDDVAGYGDDRCLVHDATEHEFQYFGQHRPTHDRPADDDSTHYDAPLGCSSV